MQDYGIFIHFYYWILDLDLFIYMDVLIRSKDVNVYSLFGFTLLCVEDKKRI